MLVVLGIIVLIMAVAMPTVSSYFQISLNSATRDLASNIKEAYNSAVITGKVYRLAFDLKENAFWVEVGPAEVLLDTKSSLEKTARKKKFEPERDSAATASSGFTMDKLITRKKISLPRGVIFEDIVNQLSPEPQTVGTVYSHFFPSGLSEQTIIHLKDTSLHQASLVISPLLGTTDLYNHYMKGAEVFGH
jgi:type II secretory pathway pseudopilin PulG